MDAGTNNTVRRFSGWRIVEHITLIVLFSILAVTGFASAYPSNGLASMLFGLSGRTGAILGVHVFCGTLLITLVIFDIATAVYGISKLGWKATMIVTSTDLAHLVSDIRHYLGFDDKQARCGRYTYKQKFTYWSFTILLLTMGLSGLILWFPHSLIVAKFGQMVPSAAIWHVNTSMALIILAVWHLYDSIFSQGSFPLDTSIFTGRISADKMKREHPLEWTENGMDERHKAEGG